MPEIIKISYASPKGQVGPRPRKVRLKEAFEVMTDGDVPGELSIEFTDKSPFKNGAKKLTVGKGKSFVVEEAGRFPFMCKLNQNGTILTLGDPADPNSAIGGELEVGC